MTGRRTGLVVVALGLLLAAPGFAQQDDQGGRRGRRGRGGPDPAQLKEELGLTDAQVQAMQELRDSMREEMMAMRENGGGFNREAFQALREKMDQKLGEVLTPEQLEKYQSMRGQRGGRGGRGRRGPDPERLKADALKALALSDEEAAVVTPYVEALVTKEQEARDAARKLRDELTQKLSQELSDDDYAAALSSYRDGQQAAQKAVDSAKSDLLGLLTIKQEAQLVRLGLLD